MSSTQHDDVEALASSTHFASLGKIFFGRNSGFFSRD